MTVSINDVTNAEVEGRGIFDELMRAAKSHIVAEHGAGRITGHGYATVYLSTMQSAMQHGIQFALQQGSASRQEELVAEQTKQVIQQTALTFQQVVNLTHEDDLITAKLAQSAQELINTTKQSELLDSQITKAAIDIQLATKQLDVVDATILKMGAEVALANAEVVYAGTKNALGIKQLTKIDSELLLLTAKVYTEQAQTLDTVNAAAVTGVIGMQKELYAKQRDGFDRDAEQKLLKFMTDNWGLRLNSDPNTPPILGMANTEADKVIAKAKAGIGVS